MCAWPGNMLRVNAAIQMNDFSAGMTVCKERDMSGRSSPTYCQLEK